MRTENFSLLFLFLLVWNFSTAKSDGNFLGMPDALDPCNEEFELDDLLDSNFDDILDLIVIPELEHEKNYNHSHLAEDIEGLRNRVDQLFHGNNKQDYEKLVLIWSYGNGGKVFEGLLIDGEMVSVDSDSDFSVPTNDCESVQVCETVIIPRLGEKHVCKTELKCKTTLDMDSGEVINEGEILGEDYELDISL